MSKKFKNIPLPVSIRQLKQSEVNWIQKEIKKQDPTYDPIKQQLKFNKEYPFQVELRMDNNSDFEAGALCQTKKELLKEIKEYKRIYKDEINDPKNQMKMTISKRIGLTDDWEVIETLTFN